MLSFFLFDIFRVFRHATTATQRSFYSFAGSQVRVMGEGNEIGCSSEMLALSRVPYRRLIAAAADPFLLPATILNVSESITDLLPFFN